MKATNEFLPPVKNKLLLDNVFKLHPVVDKTWENADYVWKFLAKWKARLQDLGDECSSIHKIIKWSGVVERSASDAGLFIQFNKLVTEDYRSLKQSVFELEKETVAALFEGEVDMEVFLVRFQKLEKELQIFDSEISSIKLQVLRAVSNNLKITFF